MRFRGVVRSWKRKKIEGRRGRNRRNAVISTRRDCISLLIRRVKKKIIGRLMSFDG